MKTTRWIGLVTLTALAPLAAVAQKPVGDFALLDHKGAFHQLSRYADQNAVVIFVQGNGCPISRVTVPTLAKIRDEFAGQGVQFLMLNANIQDDPDSIRKEAAEFSIDFPIMMDEAQLVAESLGVKRTCEVFLIDPAKKEIVFHGPVDDRADYETQRLVVEHNYLRDALTAMLAGEPVAMDVPESPGCLITFPTQTVDRDRRISYSEEIVPILKNRCVTCHQEGAIAPWAMNSYRQVRGWGSMMREVVMTKRMPPGQIDDEIGEWLDVHDITPEEQSTLVHWLDAGAPRDGSEDALTQIAGLDAGWILGEPDLIVDIPPQEVPATGTLDYRYVTLPLNLTEAKYVRAYQFNIDHHAQVHHITTSTVMLDQDTNTNPNDRSRSGFAGYAPGKPLGRYLDNVGYKVVPGMAIRASLHYTTNGKAIVDNSKIGLYFHDHVPTHEIYRWSASNNRFVIPPNTHDHPIRGERTVREDSYLYNLQPHMHFRGKRVLYTAYYPDGTVEKLLNVPNYQFNWQMIYTPKEPIFLPKGTKIVAEGAFDNSAMNLANPDPSQEIRYGPQSWDEMFIAHMQIGKVAETDSDKKR